MSMLLDLQGTLSAEGSALINALGLNQLWLFVIIIRTGNSTPGHFLRLVRCDAKLIPQKIRVQLHHFTDVFGLH
jgi:hypothetical protein